MYFVNSLIKPEYLRTPELTGLVHQLCASKVSVSSKFREKNQIIIKSLKYTVCNIHMSIGVGTGQ